MSLAPLDGFIRSTEIGSILHLELEDYLLLGHLFDCFSPYHAFGVPARDLKITSICW